MSGVLPKAPYFTATFFIAYKDVVAEQSFW